MFSFLNRKLEFLESLRWKFGNHPKSTDKDADLEFPVILLLLLSTLPS